MIRNIFLFGCSLFCFLLGGCFEDEGSYVYKDINAPRWSSDMINIRCYEGEIAVFDAHQYFEWDKDSALRESKVKYEWTLEQKVFGTEAKFEIPVDSLIQLCEDPFGEMVWGALSITDETGVPYVTRILMNISAFNAPGDWLVLSEMGGNSKLSFLKRRQLTDAARTVYYELKDENAFQTANKSEIPGRAIGLSKARSANVGALGATTIMTDKVSYVINNLGILKVSELKDEFLDGSPDNLIVTDRRDSEMTRGTNYTFLATADGRLFRRKMDPNYLGGKFLTEPYVIDEKGSKVTRFGYAEIGGAMVPCYDEKNRRVLLNVVKSESEFNWDTFEFFYYETNFFAPVTKGKGNLDNIPPVWEMPEGSEVLYLTGTAYREDIPSWSATMFTICYNDKAGNTYMGDFIVSPGETTCLQNETLKVIRFPGGNLDKDSKFLFCTSYRGPLMTVVYSKGNEIRYIDRERDNSDYPLLTFNSKVSCISYMIYGPTMYDSPYSKLLVGLEDGTLAVCDISDKRAAKIENQFNLGGRIVALKELEIRYNGDGY